MLSYLNMEYLLNEEQKRLMEELHQFNEVKLQKEKSKKYNPDDIFENRKSNLSNYEQVDKKSVAMVEYKESFFTKIKNFLRNFFKR